MLHVQSGKHFLILIGDDLVQYIEALGWTIDPTTNVVIIPPNPDNQIEATVVQETIKLPRMSVLTVVRRRGCSDFLLELTKIIAHSKS